MKKNPILFSFVRANAVWLLFIAAVNALSGGARAVGASCIQRIVDSLDDCFAAPWAFWRLIAVGCAIMLSSYALRWVSAVGARYMTEKLALETRLKLAEHLKKIPFIRFEEFKTGDLQSIVRNDSGEAAELAYNLFSRILNNVFLFAFSVWYMATISLPATVVVVAVILVTAGVNQLILARLKKHFKATRRSLGKLSAQVENAFACMDTIKTAWAKEYVLDGFTAQRRDLNGHIYRAEAIDAGRLSLYNLVNNLSLFGAVLFLGYKGISGGLSIGAAVAYIYLIKQILVPVEVIFRWMGRIVASNTAWERIFSILRLPAGDAPTADAGPGEAAQSVEVEGLGFGYEGAPQILRDLRMELHCGRILGIAGESGSGKTTLIKVLCGLYHSPSAAYRVDGRRREHLGGLVAVASGDKQLFRLSVYENIALGDRSISREACMELLDRLGFGDWVRSLPAGIDTVISPGEVSGGQRQTVSTARALLGRFPVAVLDEPFAALDSEKERLLEEELERRKGGRIIVLTSHRPNTLRGCGEILQMTSQAQ